MQGDLNMRNHKGKTAKDLALANWTSVRLACYVLRLTCYMSQQYHTMILEIPHFLGHHGGAAVLVYPSFEDIIH